MSNHLNLIIIEVLEYKKAARNFLEVL